jgi:hypothetical protein
MLKLGERRLVMLTMLETETKLGKFKDVPALSEKVCFNYVCECFVPKYSVVLSTQKISWFVVISVSHFSSIIYCFEIWMLLFSSTERGIQLDVWVSDCVVIVIVITRSATERFLVQQQKLQ